MITEKKKHTHTDRVIMATSSSLNTHTIAGAHTQLHWLSSLGKEMGFQWRSERLNGVILLDALGEDIPEGGSTYLKALVVGFVLTTPHPLFLFCFVVAVLFWRQGNWYMKLKEPPWWETHCPSFKTGCVKPSLPKLHQAHSCVSLVQVGMLWWEGHWSRGQGHDGSKTGWYW